MNTSLYLIARFTIVHVHYLLHDVSIDFIEIQNTQKKQVSRKYKKYKRADILYIESKRKWESFILIHQRNSID